MMPALKRRAGMRRTMMIRTGNVVELDKPKDIIVAQEGPPVPQYNTLNPSLYFHSCR